MLLFIKMSTCVSYVLKVRLMVICSCYTCCTVSHILDWLDIINLIRYDLIVGICTWNYFLSSDQHGCIWWWTWHISTVDPEFCLRQHSFFCAFILGADHLTVVCVLSIWPMQEAVYAFTTALLTFYFAIDLTVGHAWRATNISP